MTALFICDKRMCELQYLYSVIYEILMNTFLRSSGIFTRFNCIIYNKATRCNSGSIVFIKNYKYALHVSDALCVHLQEHYKL